MADKQDKLGGVVGGFGLGRLNQFGASLRQSAQEIGAKAAAQVSEINTKIATQLQSDGEAEDGSSQSTSIAAASTSTSPLASQTPDNMDKKELVEVMKKMNAKLKLLSNIRQQLTEKVDKAEKDKLELRTLLVDEILNGGVTIQEGQDEVTQLRTAWRQVDEQNSMALQQLQIEFKKLHAAQQQTLEKNSENGSASNHPASWDTEKQELVQKYEQEIVRVKEELNKKAEELNAAVSRVASSGTNHAEELLKIKKAAADQLQVFKQKVAAARQTEITKLKTEMNEKATQMVEEKCTELRQQYEAEIESLKSVISDKRNEQSSEGSEALQVLQQQHSAELAQIRSELEASKTREVEKLRLEFEQKCLTDAQVKVQSAVDSINQINANELESCRKVYEEQISQLSKDSESKMKSITDATEAKITLMHDELASYKKTHDESIKSLQGEIEKHRQALESETQRRLQLESELVKSRDESSKASNGEKDKLMQQFAQEKENIKVDFQRRFQAAMQKIQNDANLQKDDAVRKVREELSAKVEEIKKQMESEKVAALQQFASEAELSKNKALMEANAAAASTTEKLQKDWRDKLRTIEKQLEQQTVEYEAKSKRVLDLQAELNETKAVLDSTENVHKDSSKSLEEALTKQRLSFDERIKNQGDEFNQKIQLLSSQLNDAVESRDGAHSKIVTLESSLGKLTEQNKLIAKEYDRKLADTKVELELRDRNHAEQIGSYIRQHDESNEKYRSLESEYSRMDERLRENSQMIAEYQQQVEKMKSSLTEQEKQKEEELSAQNNSHAEAVKELNRRLEEKSSELSNLLSSQVQAKEAGNLLQQQVSNLQAKYDADIADREKKFKMQETGYLQKIDELRKTCDSLQSAQSEKEEILQKNSRTLLEYNEELQKLKQQLTAKDKEREEEISRLRKLHEEALRESSRQLDQKTSELMNLASSGNDANEAVALLKAQLGDMQAKYSADLVNRDNNLAQQTELIEGMRQKCVSFASEISQKDENLQKNSKLLAEYMEQVEKFKLQLAQLGKLKEEEISSLKLSHEKIVSEINSRLEAKASELISLSSSGDQSNELLDSLQNALNALQNKYETDTGKLQRELKVLSDELANRRQIESSLRDSIKTASAAEAELKEARQAVLDEKNAELDALKASYEAKLQESAKKEAEVARTFNKVKAAYAQKMKNIENELNQKLASLEAANATLQQAAETAKESVESLSRQHEKDVNDLRASMERKIEALVAEKEEELKKQAEKLNAEEAEKNNHEKVMLELQEKLNVLLEENDKLKASSSDALTKEIDRKVSELEQEHSSTLEKLRSKHEDEMKKLKEQLVVLQPKAEFAEVLEKQKVDLTNKLESLTRKHEEETSNLRKTMESHVDKMTAQFKEKLEAAKKASEAEINALQKLHKEKEQKLATLVDRLKSLTATSTKLRDENETLKKKLESENASQNELRAALDGLKKQFDESNANSSATATSLLQEQEKLQHEKSQLANQLKSLQSTLQTKANKIEELSGKLSALTSNLNALTEERKEQDEKLERAMKLEPKLKASEAEVADLRDQINKLKLERQKNITLVERLQAEKEANERNHGSRTALVGMLEAQLSQVNDNMAEINAKFEAALYDLNQKQETIQSQEERIRKLEADLEDAQTTAKKVSDTLAAASKSAESKATKMVESLQKELQNTKQQMVRKSTAAQQLIQQREAECAELRTANRKLQHEVDKGSYSDRRIFELAAKQSNRETLQISEIESRDKIIERLKQAVLERDGALANAEKDVREVESKIEELSRVKRREDVNIDYLKSIVVKYLSLPPGSDERARLLPVLATLLQFDEYDYKVIEEGKNKVSWWGSSVIPTLINAPLGASIPASSGSAEVSVSDISKTQASSSRTSLQF